MARKPRGTSSRRGRREPIKAFLDRRAEALKGKMREVIEEEEDEPDEYLILADKGEGVPGLERSEVSLSDIVDMSLWFESEAIGFMRHGRLSQGTEEERRQCFVPTLGAGKTGFRYTLNIELVGGLLELFAESQGISCEPICEVEDALTSRRSWRKAHTALKKLVDQSIQTLNRLRTKVSLLRPKGRPDPPAFHLAAPPDVPLTPAQQDVYDVIRAQPPGEGIQGTAILAVLRKQGKDIGGQATLTTRIIPGLKAHRGVKNRPGAERSTRKT